MPFDLSDLNPSYRFSWKDTGEWCDFRVASEEDKDRIRKESGTGQKKVEMVFNPKTMQMDRIAYYDSSEEAQQKFLDSLLDFGISDWNFKTPSGESIDCSRENKLKFVKGSPQFAKWAKECIEKAEKGESEEKAKELPNS